MFPPACPTKIIPYCYIAMQETKIVPGNLRRELNKKILFFNAKIALVLSLFVLRRNKLCLYLLQNVGNGFAPQKALQKNGADY